MYIDPIKDIKILQLIEIIKRKIFDTKKEIVTDPKTGIRSLSDISEKQLHDNLDPETRKYIEEADGWDLADKEYVNKKVKDVTDSIVKDFTKYISDTPSTISGKQRGKNLSNNSNSYVITCKGELQKGTVLFFEPGILLKECFISDIIIVSSEDFNGEFRLNKIEPSKEKENKTTVFSISKISSNIATSGEIKIKFDKAKIMYFELEGPVINNQYMLQITIEN
jgi:hypothetical protein